MKLPSSSSDAKAYGQQTLSRIDRMTVQRRVALAKTVIQQTLNDTAVPADILELGCGFRGLNLQVLSTQFPALNFHGVDLHVAQSNTPQISLMDADLTHWTPEKQYDVVLSLAVVEHLIEPLQHFRLIQDCLKPGGMSLLTSPTPPNHAVWGTLSSMGLIRDEKSGHKLYLTQAGIEDLAQTAGLQILHYQTFQFGLNQWVSLRRPETPSA